MSYDGVGKRDSLPENIARMIARLGTDTNPKSAGKKIELKKCAEVLPKEYMESLG